MEERDGVRGGSVMILNEVGMRGAGGGLGGDRGQFNDFKWGKGGSLIIFNEGGMEEMGQFNDFYMKGEYGGRGGSAGWGGGGGGAA